MIGNTAPVKIAVLGAGRWGINLIRNFFHHPQALLVAVVDPHLERLNYCREQLKLDDSIVLATDWQTALKELDLDAVAIATPASTHYQLITAALQQGYHVLAEKPLTLEPQQSLELCHLAAQQQRQLFVDHTYLFHPAVERGQKVVQSGDLGSLRYGYAARTHLAPVRQDVDALWDLAIHDIAIFNYWLGQTPQQVQANGRMWLQPDISPPLRDLVWITLTYPDGFQAFIHLCWLNPDKQRRLCLTGSQGTLIFDELQPEPLTIQYGSFDQIGDKFHPINQRREVLELATQEPLKAMCDRFLDSLHNPEAGIISSGWVGANLVQILTCLSQSLQENGRAIAIVQ